MFYIVQACAKMAFKCIDDGLQRLRLPIAYVYCLEKSLFTIKLSQELNSKTESLRNVFNVSVVSEHLCRVSSYAENSFVDSSRVSQLVHR